jgi:alpha-tubulin suppressor-like RCC1 family protein
VPVKAGISGLIPGGIYHYRLVVSNTVGVVYGTDQRFTTGMRVAAWGDNSYGQSTVPAGLSNIVAVSGGASDYDNLVLKSDGTLFEWGAFGPPFTITALSNVVALDSGVFHRLALQSDGRVAAWGDNNYGQLAVPSVLSNAVAIGCGLYHSLAVREDGTVVAWGDNGYGQLNVPEGLSNVVAVAGGFLHSLALRADGTVVAWGLKTFGEAIVPDGLSNIVAIAGGSAYSLALRADGTLVGWGSVGTIPSGATNLVAMVACDSHNLALRADGAVIAWGANSRGESTVPVGLKNVVMLGGGSQHSMSLGNNVAPVAHGEKVNGFGTNDVVITLTGSDPNTDAFTLRLATLPTRGALYQYDNGGRGAAIVAPGTIVSDAQGRVIFAPDSESIGSNPYASFGFLTNDGDLDSPTAVVTIHNFPAYATTQAPTGISTNGATLNGMATPGHFPAFAWFEWGNRDRFESQTSPKDIGTGSAVVRISDAVNGVTASGIWRYRLVVSNALGVVYGAEMRFTTGMKVTAWGQNSQPWGQTNVPTGLSDVIAVDAGDSHSLALKIDGTIVGWGDNTFGQLNVPSSLSNGVAVAGGTRHSIALKADGTVVAWGGNNYGQTNVPTGLSNVVAIAANGSHSLALRADGTVAAWGANLDGQAIVPPSLMNVVVIAAGWSHSLALKADGTVVGWGKNTSAQASSPMSLDGVAAVSAGADHDVELKTDGTVVSSGLNNPYGQLTVPQGLSNVIAITAGAYHNLALKADGTVIGWGRNNYGQASVPDGLNNVVAVAGGAYFNLVMGNRAPLGGSQSISGYANRDLVVTLGGTDPDGDSVKFRVTSIASAGTLYQYELGVRGSAITAVDTAVTDAQGRVLFAPAPGGWGSAYSSFSFVANDGLSDSLPSTVTIDIILPPAPQITGFGWSDQGTFNLSFSGDSNAIYQVWASTNLMNWQVLGTASPLGPGQFKFTDGSATDWPKRFYRAGAP